MTDLRERLRSSSPYLHGSSAERTMAEAADEIERLTAYAQHERSLGAEGPMIELVSARQEIERLTADNKQLRDDFWRERERVDLLRAEIEGLRAEVERQKASAEYWRGEAVRAADTLPPLRAEIERLLAALESLTKDPPQSLAREPDEDWEVIVKMRAIARAALEPKP